MRRWQQARDAGVDVIVVDHHKCASELPIATALVNPNRLDESEAGAAFGHLAAVGVAFLLAVATLRSLRQTGYFKTTSEPNLLSLLDLVALGTVADVAALHGLNRAMVAQGLKVMARRENVGMAALIDAARLTRAPSCSDLGFALGPRINAGGRVGESTLGVRLLTTEDPDEARDIAEQLSRLNEERRGIEAVVQEEAEAQIAGQHNRAVLVLAGHGWHPGVIGIVAGRIKEKAGKPALVIALDADEAGNGKGSGRSISGVDLGAAIIAAKDAGLLLAGGGHAMAAGLTIAPGKSEALADWLDAQAGSGRFCRRRQPVAQARPRAGPARPDPRPRHPARKRRPLRQWLARPESLRRPGPAGQGGHCRQRPPAPDRARRRWRQLQGHRLPRGQQRDGPGAAPRRAGPQAVAGGPRQDRRLVEPGRRQSCISRMPPGRIEGVGRWALFLPRRNRNCDLTPPPALPKGPALQPTASAGMAPSSSG